MLKAVIAVAENGTFSKAASAVFVTHAAASLQINTLEELLNIELFDRTKRPPELTPIGRAFVERARAIVCDYEGIVDAVIGDDGLTGVLLLRAVPTTLVGLVPLAVSSLKVAFPNLHICIIPGLTNDLLRGIERGSLDAAIISQPTTPRKNQTLHHIATEPLQLRASPELDSDDPIYLLKNNPFIRFSRDAVVGKVIETWLQEQGLLVTNITELESLEAMSNMVLGNLGVSIAPRRCEQKMNPSPLERRLLLENGPVRQLGLLSPSNTAKTRVIDKVLNAMLDAVARGHFASPVNQMRTSDVI